MAAMKTIQVHEYPKCDFCGAPAEYDDKTTKGPWANMCAKHQEEYGFSIGTKRVLIKKRKATRTFDKVPTATFKLTRAIMFDEVMPKVKCPWCGQKRTCEMDANYLVTCESCEKPYRISSPI